MTIASEEVFGPVLSVLTATDETHAIEIANSTPYGLVMNGIFTSDIDCANRSARALRSGQVFINEWFAGGVETPFEWLWQIWLWTRKGPRGFVELSSNKEYRDQNRLISSG